MPKSPDDFAGPGDRTEVMAAATPEELAKRKAEMQREVIKQRGEEIAEDAAKFVKDTAAAAKARLGTGVTSLMGRLGTALSGAWSGLGRAAGRAWDGALLGVGYGAVAVDKTVETAGAVRTAAVDAAVGTKDAVVRGAEVTRDAAVAGYEHMTDLNKSETVQAYRGAKRMAGEGAEYIAGKAGEAGEYFSAKANEASEYVTTQFNTLRDRVLDTGRAIIESKAGKYTAKALKYAGVGTGVAIGVPLAIGGYAVGASILAFKDPEGLQMVRGAVKEAFPTAGMNVGEAIEKVGKRISEKGRESAASAWDRMTNAWDGLKNWANTKRVAMMERAGVASMADVKKAMSEAAELRAQLAELRAQMNGGSSNTESGAESSV